MCSNREIVRLLKQCGSHVLRWPTRALQSVSPPVLFAKFLNLNSSHFKILLTSHNTFYNSREGPKRKILARIQSCSSQHRRFVQEVSVVQSLLFSIIKESQHNNPLKHGVQKKSITTTMVTSHHHPNLTKLYEVREILSYKGWQEDFQDAQDAHQERSYSTDFPKALRKMKVKQKLHDGDRSHPRLVTLDAIVRRLSYPGWKADVQQIEKMHADVPYFASSDVGFNSKLRALEYSQSMHEQQTGGSSSSSARYNEEEDEEVSIASSSSSSSASSSLSPRSAAANDEDGECSHGALGCCTICGDGPKSHAFLPCGHLSSCGGCSSKIMRRTARCPVCRCSAIDTVQIYV